MRQGKIFVPPPHGAHMKMSELQPWGTRGRRGGGKQAENHSNFVNTQPTFLSQLHHCQDFRLYTKKSNAPYENAPPKKCKKSNLTSLREVVPLSKCTHNTPDRHQSNRNGAGHQQDFKLRSDDRSFHFDSKQ